MTQEIERLGQRPSAFLKFWTDAEGHYRCRVDMTDICEPWLDALKPTITPLYTADALTALIKPDGYSSAFYEMAALLGVTTSQAASPQEVYETQIKPRLTALIKRPEAGERDISGETVFGLRVAAYRETHPEHGDKYGHRYSEHWSTPSSRDPRVKVERLFTEEQVASLIKREGELREALTHAQFAFNELRNVHPSGPLHHSIVQAEEMCRAALNPNTESE